MNRSALPSRRGFTLLEAVVAIAILVVIASLTWSAVAGSLSARDLLAEQDVIGHRRTVHPVFQGHHQHAVLPV